MSAKFTDAVVQNVIVNVRDSKGRQASISFDEQGVHFHRSRPKQGREAIISYDRFLDLAEEGNRDFFKAPKRR